MDVIQTEIVGYVLLDKCKCCLGEDQLKDLWTEYCECGKKEIYGEMLNECFDLNDDVQCNTEAEKRAEKICVSCICRLRNALEFKREVLACAKLWLEQWNNGFVLPKGEVIDSIEEEDCYEADGTNQNVPDTCSIAEQKLPDNDFVEYVEDECLEVDEHNENVPEAWGVLEENFEAVEYLDIDDHNVIEDFISPDDDGVEYIEEGYLEVDGSNQNVPDSFRIKDESFEAVEYLDVDDHNVVEVTINEDCEPEPTSARSIVQRSTNKAKSLGTSQDRQTRKWPEKNEDEPRRRRKQYTVDDMLKAMKTVQSGQLTISDASLMFNLPRKTLATKLVLAKKYKGDNERAVQSELKQEQMQFKFIKEVKKILTYTNATPFKTKTTRYYCFYCPTKVSYFEDPDELRAHTRTQHVDEKTRLIEMVLRRRFLNEVIKVDIESLHCTVCCTVIPSWTDMFQHLEETHNVELDQAYTKVIPYILKRDLRCALCQQRFPNYNHLDIHMNSHYASYICAECGDPFLSNVRLTVHKNVHKTGEFPCEGCGKVFARDIYRQKHYDHAHKQEHNIKCLYCPEKFLGTYQRHLHVVEKHNEKVNITTCELCGMKFDYKHYYVAHMRRKHKIRTIQSNPNY